jgi:Toprim-like/CHC2 zinc finger
MRPYTLAEALRYGRGIERPFLCPEHGDSRPSATVNTVKGVWFCFTCHAHGTLTGEARLAEPDYHSMRLWLDRRLEDHRVYPESWLDRWDAGPVHPYWHARVGTAAARHFRLGHDAESGAVTYPLRDPSGGVLGVVRRALDVQDGPKYRYPTGADIGQLLFNYTPLARAAVVLTEGAVDAVALWNVGIEAFAIYGSRLSAAQVRLIDRIDPEYVYTCYDLDQAGWTAYLETQRAFKHRLVDRLSWPKAWGADIAEIHEDRRRHVVDDLVSSGLACIE